MCPGQDGHSQCMRAEYTARQLDFNEQISEMEPQRRSWHLMRHPGLCGLRAVICALIVLALCVVLTLIPRKWTDPEPVMNGTASVSHTLGQRRLRETANSYMASLSDSWMDHPSPPHPYATNMWWRLANHSVKEYVSKNCYVCTQFPHSTTGLDWWPHQDHNTSTFMAMVAVAAADFNDNQSYDVSYMQDEGWTTIRLTKRLFGKVATVRNIPSNLTCYRKSSFRENTKE